MTRLLTTGWELNDINESGYANYGGGTMSVVSSNPTPRGLSNYCLKTVQQYRGFALPSAKSEVWARFGFLVHGTGNSDLHIITLSDSTDGNSLGNFQIVVTFGFTDQLLKVWRGNRSTLLGSSSLTVSYDIWHTIEVHWLATSQTSGTVEVWADGIQYVNLVGVDNTNTGNLYVLAVYLSVNVLATGAYYAFDDFAVNDTLGTINNGRIGDGQVLLLKPNGAGSSTQLTRGGTDTGANWSQVNEVPASMTQYVSSPVIGNRDLYSIEDLPHSSYPLNVCDVVAYGQSDEYGTGMLALTIKSGATTSETNASIAMGTPTYLRGMYETDPNTGAAWTVAAVNAAEVGVTVR